MVDGRLDAERVDVMREAVARGVELLDAKVPGWWQRIDVAELELADCSQCVLAQLFPNPETSWAAYSDGMLRIGLVDGREHGFDLPKPEHAMSSREAEKEWDALRELWVEEIKERWDEGFDIGE